MEDGARMGFDEFVEVLGAALAAAGGTTIFIASADLSHAGPAFGEPATVNDQRRREVESHDRAMMKSYIADAGSLVAQMRELRNQTRWTSVGALVAAARLAKPSSI